MQFLHRVQLINPSRFVLPMAARRKTKKKTPRRRRSGAVNLINTAQSLVVANAGTKAFFGTNLVPFLTEGWLTGKSAATNNSWELSMAEIVQRLTGEMGGMSPSWDERGIMGAIKYNIRNNPQALVTLIAAPTVFTVAKKITAKPRRDANKLLKMAGLSTVVKV